MWQVERQAHKLKVSTVYHLTSIKAEGCKWSHIRDLDVNACRSSRRTKSIGEDLMSAKITPTQLLARIAGDPDMYALGLLPIDCFARHAYQTKTFPAIRGAHKASDADEIECKQWSLTSEEWVEEMDAARLALAHDMKLDLLRKGFAGAV
jgi:hypothetical protein